jgi:hypothetical protein
MVVLLPTSDLYVTIFFFVSLLSPIIYVQVDVPKAFVGYIIGRGGETIKRISQESGSKVQFDTCLR